MTLLSRREHAHERMDRPDVDPGALAAALDHVAAVNRWLGGRRALLRHLPDVLPDAPSTRADGVARVLDVGTGSADLPVTMIRWARDHRRALDITALDLHERTLEVGAARTADEPAIHLVRGNGLRLPFDTGTFDLALLSMTLHHMDGPELVELIRELARAALGGRIVIAELERSLPNYLGARLLGATLWRRNPVTRHDGPLSVLRAFTPGELRDLALEAGLRNARVHRHWFYRLVLVADSHGD